MNTPLLGAALILAFALRLSADDASAPTNAASATPPDNTLRLALNSDVGLGSEGAVKDQDSYQVRIGELYAPAGEAYIIPVRLPALPAGQRIATAHLRFQLIALSTEGSGPANADLYCLGLRDSIKPLPADYYQGSKPDQKATLIQANFLTPASKVRTDQVTGPFVESSADGDAALAKYLNDACAKPENAGKYVILRISYDADPIPDGNNAYMLLTSGASGDDETPQITCTLAPKK